MQPSSFCIQIFDHFRKDPYEILFSENEFSKNQESTKEVDYQICKNRWGIQSLDELASCLGKKKCRDVNKLLSIPGEFMTSDIVKFTENVKKIERLFPNLTFVSFNPTQKYVGHVSLSMFKWDTDLNIFAHSKITSLYISCSKISDFSPLEKAKNIQKLSLIDCDNIKAFEFLLNMPALRELDFIGPPIPYKITNALEAKGVKIWQPFN
jgi:Leucine-rich repeat (LRR) protein